MNDKLRLALGYVLCALYTSGLSHPLQSADSSLKARCAGPCT